MEIKVVKILGSSDEYTDTASEGEIILNNSFITVGSELNYTDLNIRDFKYKNVTTDSILKSDSKIVVYLSSDKIDHISVDGVVYPSFTYEDYYIDSDLLTITVNGVSYSMIIESDYYTEDIVSQILDNSKLEEWSDWS